MKAAEKFLKRNIKQMVKYLLDSPAKNYKEIVKSYTNTFEEIAREYHNLKSAECAMHDVVASKQITCTLGWDGAPTTCEDGMVLPRRAEMIINAKYYPSGKVGEWPKDPKTGKDLEIYRAY